MKYYLAPLEGITTCAYRKVYHKYYTAMDKYFTPFLSPHNKRGFSTKEKRELFPEYNEGMYLVPQILTNHAADCLDTMRKLEELGYQEINLNMGCPSKTVVSKNKGSGFLAYPEELDHFLEEIFVNTKLKISVKTRIGKESIEEFPRLLEIYNKYPLEELIIHPRTQTEFYKYHPHLDVFADAVKMSKHSLCYNGDIISADDEKKISEQFPNIEAIMIGRGIIRNPWLLETVKEGKSLDKQKFQEFHDELLNTYLSMNYGEKPALFKMKELWAFTKADSKEMEKALKKIRKSEKLVDYNRAMKTVLTLL